MMCFTVPMDLESDDEDKENDVADIKEVTEDDEIDEKERSHCMEEMWEGGGCEILINVFLILILSLFTNQESSYRQNQEESAVESYR